MASSKKSKEEENKKKRNRKETNTSTTRSISKPKTNTNGTVKNGVHEVIIVPSSSCDSQESQEQEQEQEEVKRSQKRVKKWNNNKSKRKENEEEEEEETKMCVFPMSRIKRKIKSEGSDSTLDAVFLVNKASEMFIEQFCEDAYECSVHDRKKSLHYNHLSSVISKQRRYDFLSDFVPEKLKAEDALAEWKSAETGGG